MAPVPDLVCVGHVVREMIHFPDRVEGPFLGGPPAYCSVAAARQGTSTGLVTKIGPDVPEALLRPFAEAGVDVAGLRRSGNTTCTGLYYDAHGNKEIRYADKADPVRAEDVPESYSGCGMIYVCTMDNDVPLDDLSAIVALGKLSAVDLGGYGGVHMAKSDRAGSRSHESLACMVSERFRIVKVSDEDAKLIWGRDDPDVAAREILACGVELAIVTAGAKGAFVYKARNRWHVPPLAGHVFDTTGGGDTFMAGFLSEYLRSGNPLRSAQWGTATARCVIEKTGGVWAERMPTRQDVVERLNAARWQSEEKDHS